MSYFFVGCRTTFLFRSYPIPMSVRFVERTDVIELDAIMFFHSLYYICQKTDVLFITIRLQICRTSTTGIGCQSILCIMYGRRVQESQEFIDSPFLCQFQKIALSLLLVPVVRSIRVQKTLGSHPGRGDLTSLPLFRTACTDIETPEGQTDTFRLSVRIILRTEQPIGYLVLFLFRPKSDKLHTPGV